MIKYNSLARECAGEVVGTFILVFFGVGSVHVAVLTGALAGLWQVAIVWGLGISLAIYALGSVSGAHMNPALTAAFAMYRDFPVKKVPAYVLAQLTGAIAAAATLYGLFHGLILRFEQLNSIVRGQSGSELSAMIYGDYFPNPAIVGVNAGALACVSHGQAMLAEGLGTAFLAFFVFAMTHEHEGEKPAKILFGLMIGLTVSIIICVVAPLTGAGLNPARDFGPRLFAWVAGWGPVAIPGPRGGFFTVYILSPILGSLAGAGVFQLLIHPRTAAAQQPSRASEREGATP
jgi:glycerol uptake facilitator protein